MSKTLKFEQLVKKIILEAETKSDSELLEMFNQIKSTLNNFEFDEETVDKKLLIRMFSLVKRLSAGAILENNLVKALQSHILLTQAAAEDLSDEICNLVNSDAIQSLTDYINNEDKRLDINDYLGIKIPIKTLINQTNVINANTIFDFLLHKKVDGKTAQGNGELFTAIIFKHRT